MTKTNVSEAKYMTNIACIQIEVHERELLWMKIGDETEGNMNGTYVKKNGGREAHERRRAEGW